MNIWSLITLILIGGFLTMVMIELWLWPLMAGWFDVERNDDEQN